MDCERVGRLHNHDCSTGKLNNLLSRDALEQEVELMLGS